MPVWYCKQPSGGLMGELQAYWVTLTSKPRLPAALPNSKLRVAPSELPVPSSTKTRKFKVKFCLCV